MCTHPKLAVILIVILIVSRKFRTGHKHSTLTLKLDQKSTLQYSTDCHHSSNYVILYVPSYKTSVANHINP
ncbi:hypothetical protein EB796_009443 [Bugula neritina]|uniref:Secreted protein n=1 Tax=Bugula neritina TaxID=10212 RepID=A0A7J7K2S1_BUGNE|nr:hypothetical protein EB796_009443 [Bugula neritina]